MDSVSLFVKTIVTVTFMWCMAEAVLPENSMQKYSSFVYGLVIISLAISVFTNLKYEKIFVPDNTANISEYNSDYIKKLYEKNLEKILTEKFGDNSLKVELTDDYKIKKISCDSKKTYDDVMRYLNE